MYRPSARAEIIAALLVGSGKTTSLEGRASRQLVEVMQDRLSRTRDSRKVASLLKAMEDDGEIVRDVAGRRTYSIAIHERIPAGVVLTAIAILWQSGHTGSSVAGLLRNVGLFDDLDQVAGDFDTGALDGMVDSEAGDTERLEHALNYATRSLKLAERERDEAVNRYEKALEVLTKIPEIEERGFEALEFLKRHLGDVSGAAQEAREFLRAEPNH